MNKIKKILCRHSTEYADKWTAIDTQDNRFPYSKLLKDKTVDNWLEQGHIVGHKKSASGLTEEWIFIN